MSATTSIATGWILLMLLALPQVVAQEVQSIAAVVNDEVISAYDLDQRLKLLFVTARIADNPASRKRLRQRVLRSLIDEKIQTQEARRFNTSVTDADIDRGIRVVEGQNKMKPGDLKRFLTSKRVDFVVFIDRLRAEIAWSKLIGRRLRPSLRIGEDEIDEVEKQIAASKDEPAFLISEIFMPIDSPDQEADTRQTAQRLVADINRGARFAEMARQYSEGVTAFNGGDVGWVRPGQLSREVTAALMNMDSGVSDPIRTSAGYYVIELRDRRSTKEPAGGTVSLKQIVLPIEKGASSADIDKQRGLAQTISASIQRCDDVEKAIAEIESPQSGDLGTLNIFDLPTEFQSVARELPIGKGSAPILREARIHIIVVCSREIDSISAPDRESIARALRNTRLSLMARRYLRDLRRDAIVEIR